MSCGFRIDLSGWDLTGHRGKLQSWVDKFFVDGVWVNDDLLVGWLSESHTVPGMRDLVHHNLKNWKCSKLRRYQRNWVDQLTASEFNTLVGRVPRPLRNTVLRVIRRTVDVAVKRVLVIEKARVEAERKTTEANLRLCAMAFNALRANAPRASANRVEQLRQKVAHFRTHLISLERLRTELPGTPIYLPPDWETKTPEEAHAWREQRGVKRTISGFSRVYEEKIEADMLRQMELELADAL